MFANIKSSCIFVGYLKNNAMKTYSEQIVKAHNNWMDKIVAVPDEEWHPNYKKAKAADKRAGNKFISLCRISDLNYLQVCKDLTNYTL